MDSIIHDALSVLQIPYYKDLYGPERKPVLFHLHFQVNPTPANSRRKFNIKSARESNPASFLHWVGRVPEMQADIMASYKRLVSSLCLDGFAFTFAHRRKRRRRDGKKLLPAGVDGPTY